MYTYLCMDIISERMITKREQQQQLQKVKMAYGRSKKSAYKKQPEKQKWYKYYIYDVENQFSA